jgi:hypothetical protein
MLRFSARGGIVGTVDLGATWMSLLRFFPEVLW